MVTLTHGIIFYMRDSNGRFTKGHEVPDSWKQTSSEKNKGRINIKNSERVRSPEELDRLKKQGFQKGMKPSNYKGGFIEKAGYKVVTENNVRNREHRIVTNVPKGSIVHHINGIKSDNRPENLQIMTQSEHIKLHNPVLHRWHK